MLKKNVLRACFIGIALMMQGAHAAAPNTVIGCVQNANAGCPFIAPGAIAITPNGKKAYIGIRGHPVESVAVVNVATDTVTACVDNDYADYCGFILITAIAITPDGTKAYVCNNVGVNVIDVDTDTVTQCVDNTYCYFSIPQAIAITPNSTKAYVVNLLGGTGHGSVSVIDVATDTVTDCVDDTLCPMFDPRAIAITPNGTKAYLVSQFAVHVIDVGTNAVTKCVTNVACPLSNPIAIAITPDGTKAYVCNTNGENLVVIDVQTDTVTGCITSGNPDCVFTSPKAIAITPDSTTAYVCNQDNNSVTIVDLSSGTVSGCVENTDGYCMFNSPLAIAITPDGTKAYVSNNGGNVSIIALPISPTPSILPPASVSGCKTRNIFLLQTDFINNITWTAPASGTAPVAYKIYRDPALTQLVATVPASGALQYYDHDRNPGIIYSYYIVSVDGSGNVSTANSVTVTTSC